MIPELSNYLSRLSAGINQATDLSQLAKWIEDNTTDPRNPDRNWSFVDHEYQIDILNDTAEDIAVQKCSQVGMSELSVRMVLAMAGIFKAITGIYVLPTTSFARKFAQQRVDPVVDNSKSLKGLVSKDTDNSELKRFGNSFLYFMGSQKEGISVPANLLVIDEIDFCSQRNLTTYSSRLRHADPGYKRQFSTPTVTNFGVNKLFNDSTQGYYAQFCRHCETHVIIHPETSLTIPGYEGAFMELDKSDIEPLDTAEAYVHCPICVTRIEWEDICNAELRKWIHTKPDAARKGYQVFPWDVPKYNRLDKVLNQITEYESISDYFNFVWGLPHESSDRSFMATVILQNTVSMAVPVPPEGVPTDPEPVMYGTVLGLDVGKTSWLTIGRKTLNGDLEVIYQERIRQDGENYLVNRVLFLARYFGVLRGVVDAGPDFSSSQALVEQGLHQQFWACYYTQGTKSKVEPITTKDAEGVVNVVRTISFDGLSKMVNGHRVKFQKSDEQDIALKHLKALKRVEETTDEGVSARWISTDDDHYAHSLNYMYVASRLLDAKFGFASGGVLPMLGSFKLAEEGDSDDLNAQAESMVSMYKREKRLKNQDFSRTFI